MLERIGRLTISRFWEQELNGYDTIVTEEDGIGLFAQTELAPRRKGNDPIVKRYYRLAVYNDVTLTVPSHTPFESVELDNGMAFKVAKFNNVRVHLHGAIEPVGGQIRGRMSVVIETWEPKGAAQQSDGRQAWRNYALFVDFHPLAEGESEETRRQLVIEQGNPTASGNICAAGHFATRSADEKIQQMLVIQKRKPDTKAALGDFAGADKLAEFARILHSRQQHGASLERIKQLINDWQHNLKVEDILGRDPTPKFEWIDSAHPPIVFGPSNIAGNGVIVVKKIPKGAILGPTHRMCTDGKWEMLHPLGNYNHAEEFNAVILKNPTCKQLKVVKDLLPGDEILVNYQDQPDLEQPGDGWVN